MTLTRDELDGLRDIWWGILRRCEDPKRKDYRKYGGRGIRVCEEWHDFDNFKAWAEANGFHKGLTVDRYCNNRGYNPNNCRFKTVKQQAYNRSTNTYITVNGVTRTLTEWSKITGVPDYVICKRRKAGWSDHDAVMTPKGSRRHTNGEKKG